jgi:hypothetical protein
MGCSSSKREAVVIVVAPGLAPKVTVAKYHDERETVLDSHRCEAGLGDAIETIFIGDLDVHLLDEREVGGIGAKSSPFVTEEPAPAGSLEFEESSVPITKKTTDTQSQDERQRCEKWAPKLGLLPTDARGNSIADDHLRHAPLSKINLPDGIKHCFKSTGYNESDTLVYRFENTTSAPLIVTIPCGTIFMPKDRSRTQNLVIRDRLEETVLAKCTKDGSTHAFCGNVNFDCSTGRTMVLTDFRVSGRLRKPVMSQSRLWEDLEAYERDKRETEMSMDDVVDNLLLKAGAKMKRIAGIHVQVRKRIQEEIAPELAPLAGALKKSRPMTGREPRGPFLRGERNRLEKAIAASEAVAQKMKSEYEKKDDGGSAEFVGFDTASDRERREDVRFVQEAVIKYWPNAKVNPTDRAGLLANSKFTAGLLDAAINYVDICRGNYPVTECVESAPADPSKDPNTPSVPATSTLRDQQEALTTAIDALNDALSYTLDEAGKAYPADVEELHEDLKSRGDDAVLSLDAVERMVDTGQASVDIIEPLHMVSDVFKGLTGDKKGDAISETKVAALDDISHKDSNSSDSLPGRLRTRIVEALTSKSAIVLNRLRDSSPPVVKEDTRLMHMVEQAMTLPGVDDLIDGELLLRAIVVSGKTTRYINLVCDLDSSSANMGRGVRVEAIKKQHAKLSKYMNDLAKAGIISGSGSGGRGGIAGKTRSMSRTRSSRLRRSQSLSAQTTKGDRNRVSVALSPLVAPALTVSRLKNTALFAAGSIFELPECVEDVLDLKMGAAEAATPEELEKHLEKALAKLLSTMLGSVDGNGMSGETFVGLIKLLLDPLAVKEMCERALDLNFLLVQKGTSSPVEQLRRTVERTENAYNKANSGMFFSLIIDPDSSNILYGDGVRDMPITELLKQAHKLLVRLENDAYKTKEEKRIQAAIRNARKLLEKFTKGDKQMTPDEQIQRIENKQEELDQFDSDGHTTDPAPEMPEYQKADAFKGKLEELDRFNDVRLLSVFQKVDGSGDTMTLQERKQFIEDETTRRTDWLELREQMQNMYKVFEDADGLVIPFDDAKLVTRNIEIFANLSKMDKYLRKRKKESKPRMKERMNRFQELVNDADVVAAAGANRVLDARALMVYSQLDRQLLARLKNYQERGVKETTKKIVQCTLLLLGFGSEDSYAGRTVHKQNSSVRRGMEEIESWQQCRQLMSLRDPNIDFLLSDFSVTSLEAVDKSLMKKAEELLQEVNSAEELLQADGKKVARQSAAVDTFYHWCDIILGSWKRKSRRVSRTYSMRSSQSMAARAGSFSNE